MKARYDEFRIDTELEDINEFDVDTVTLPGEIDHLIATEDTYHVINYKTDRPRSQDTYAFIAAQSKHHKPQIFAYAAALKQANPTRNRPRLPYLHRSRCTETRLAQHPRTLKRTRNPNHRIPALRLIRAVTPV